MREGGVDGGLGLADTPSGFVALGLGGGVGFSGFMPHSQCLSLIHF